MKFTRCISMFLITLAAVLVVVTASADRDGASGDRGPRGDGFQLDGSGPPLVLNDDDRKNGEGRGNRNKRRQLAEEDIDTAMEVVVAVYPELTDKLKALQEEDPEKLRETLEKKFPRVRFLVALKDRDPEMFKLRLEDITLERKTHEISKKLRKARKEDDKATYKDLRDALEELVAEHFDVRQSIREREIEMLREKLEELEEHLDDRDDDRKDIIEQHVNELAGPEW